MLPGGKLFGICELERFLAVLGEERFQNTGSSGDLREDRASAERMHVLLPENSRVSLFASTGQCVRQSACGRQNLRRRRASG